MKMVVGLGNPGRQYERTRHNVGFMTVDELAARHGRPAFKEQMSALVARARIGDEDVLLVKPQTFMNLSGEAVGRLWRWHKLAIKDVLVVSDDMDLPFGKLRLRERGSAGGHNGLKSIFAHLRSQEVARLKIGVGRPEDEGREAIDHVLSPFTPAEREDLPLMLSRASDAVELALREGIVPAMNEINPPAKPPKPKQARPAASGGDANTSTDTTEPAQPSHA